MQSTVKQAEKDWDTRKQQIADDTVTTISVSKTAIAEATANGKSELQVIQQQIADSNKEFQELRAVHITDTQVLEQVIEDLEHTKKVLSNTNVVLQDDNRMLQSEITIARETLNGLNTDIGTLKEAIATAHEQKQRLEDEVAILQSQSDTLTQRVEQLQNDIRTKTEQYNTNIAILEQKKQDLTTEIVENRAADEKVRENLASWSKTLDERDKNLRIRESKVNEQEKSIARNYNLLNL